MRRRRHKLYDYLTLLLANEVHPSPPIGPAGGDLGGAYPNPTVDALTGGVGGVTVRGNSTPLNWPVGSATLDTNGSSVLSLGFTTNDFIAIGLSPAIGGGIRLDNPVQILYRSVTAQTSPTFVAIRGEPDDSVTVGGIGTRGIGMTVYTPDGLTDRNIVFQIYADSTQPTKDFIALGGPDPTNVHGVHPVAGSGFVRVPQPITTFTVLAQRNAADNGDDKLIEITPGNYNLGSFNVGNLALQSANNFEINNQGQLSVHMGDNGADDCLFLFGHHNAEMDINFGAHVTLAKVKFASAATAANGAPLVLSGQDATGAGNNGGPARLYGGSSAAGNQGTASLGVNSGGGEDLLTVGDGGLHTQPSGNIAITTGTVTLTLAEYQFSYLQFNGALTGNVIIVLPSTFGATWIIDATAVTLNGFTITLQAAGTNWGTTIGVTNLYRVTFGGSTSKLFGETLTP